MSVSTNMRRQEILQYVNKIGSCSVKSIINEFNFSPATIRRDISYLYDEGLLRHTHGNIESMQAHSVSSFQERKNAYHSDKILIAKCAAQLIQNGESILIDGGTTTDALYDYLTPFKNLTLITNSLTTPFHRESLSRSVSTLILLGGMVDLRNAMTIGPCVEQMLDTISADIVFLGTTGLNAESGFATKEHLQASIKQKMILRAKKKVMLADSHKLASSGIFHFASFEDIDILITSAPIKDPALQQQLENANVKIIVA